MKITNKPKPKCHCCGQELTPDEVIIKYFKNGNKNIHQRFGNKVVTDKVSDLSKEGK